MSRFCLILVSALFGSSTLLANPLDSLEFLSPYDTVYLHSDFTNEKFLLHTMQPQQTLYSLAKFYGLHVEDLYYYNMGLRERNMEAGRIIKIPIPNRAIIRYKTHEYVAGQYIPVYYVVKRGDTMFRISKVLFRMEVDEMVARNGLETTDLVPGQILHIGWMNINGISSEVRSGGGGPLARRNQAMKSIYYRQVSSKNQSIVRGLLIGKRIVAMILIFTPFMIKRNLTQALPLPTP